MTDKKHEGNEEIFFKGLVHEGNYELNRSWLIDHELFHLRCVVLFSVWQLRGSVHVLNFQCSQEFVKYV